MNYIGNGFSANMIEGDATIKITTITKEEFTSAGETAKSIIGHPEIAETFGLTLNRESITLKEGDTLYVVSPAKRPLAGKSVEDGAKYTFIPEREGYAYKKVEIIEVKN